ncbi:golgin subfamily A member 5 isoform X1 [Brienomyrus brachyistius]|uniref:golgin subfamily A member 5 isoform X1 n=1 Tax=Brienomyrus brachyistius TaxID=42636 RepID=UPI0020B27A22|nr:golgin subfamily A member 5 isoform X1 [Brienomyrus brachyistius]
MSWLADLAGKAEDFLNKVDQGAASALTKHQSRDATFYDTPDSAHYGTAYKPAVPEQQQSYHTSHDTPAFITAAASNIKKSSATLLAGTANSASASFDSAGSSGPGFTKASSNFVRPKKAEMNDDVLFDFLNSSDPTSNRKRNVKKEQHEAAGIAEGSPTTSSADTAPPSEPSLPYSKTGLFRSSSFGSLSTSTDGVKISEEGSTETPSQETPESSDSGLAGRQGSTVEDPVSVEEQQGQVMSSLRLENQLLRNEVASLNQEMATLLQRAKDSQEELAVARAHADKRNSDQSRTDRTIRELMSQVDDLKEALSAKDGQLAVLKVRLEEADQLVLSHNKALEAAQCERSRILQDHTEGSKMHSQALETLQERLRDSESALKREQECCRQLQSEFADRLTKVEAEKQTLAETVTASERRVGDDRRRVEEVQQQLRSARSAAESAKQELQDYKHKASRILQSKEKLISSLKEGAGLEVLEGGGTGALELEELRHEKELQRDEIQRLQGQIQALRTEMQDVEMQALAEAESWREQQRELQEQHALQTQAKQEVEAELERYKQELQYAEEENRHMKSTLQSRIKDREEEIQKLRNQLTNKTLSTSSQAELESRLHQLTETLIQKQTMLEALGTEKSSLVFQLERLEEQMKSIQGSQANGPCINMDKPGTGARARNVPVLFSDPEGPSAGMYSKVRRAASTIDKFSIRLGIFLRRYPMARVFVILYMALLHLWVMIVLLTYTPEMHHSHPGRR